MLCALFKKRKVIVLCSRSSFYGAKSNQSFATAKFSLKNLIVQEEAELMVGALSDPVHPQSRCVNGMCVSVFVCTVCVCASRVCVCVHATCVHVRA